MDNEQQTHRNYLYRLITLFMAMAMQADRASYRSSKVRFIVLCILRPAALYFRFRLRAQAHALGMEIVDLPPLLKGSSPAAARRLAAFFCAMAQVLEVIAGLENLRQSYADGWTIYGVLAPVLSAPAPLRMSHRPVSRGMGFRALDSPLAAAA